MGIVTINEIHLIGLSLQEKTTNDDGKSSIDCGNLWTKFHEQKYADIITNKLSEELLGVYYDYEGDSTKPFCYFIGYKVKKDAAVPEGLQSLLIPAGNYQKIVANGKMPDCVIDAWKAIWISNYARTYQMDFEVYDQRSSDWNNAEVDVYLSIKQ